MYFAPNITWRSFITLITLVQVATFIICIFGSIFEYGMLSPLGFLGANTLLFRNFDKSPKKISEGQIWRLITPIFLHTSFSHLTHNILSQVFYGCLLEGMVGFKHIAVMYAMCGIGGNIFSSVIDSSPSIGCSTSVCGILTGALSMIFINWQSFNGNQQLEQTRCILMFIIIIMIILNLSIVNSASAVYKTDTYGHLGGAITGLIWGLAFFPRVKND